MAFRKSIAQQLSAARHTAGAKRGITEAPCRAIFGHQPGGHNKKYTFGDETNLSFIIGYQSEHCRVLI